MDFPKSSGTTHTHIQRQITSLNILNNQSIFHWRAIINTKQSFLPIQKKKKKELTK